MALPVQGRPCHMEPANAENGGVDWGAFATVDFERTMPEFDKAKYKADKLREKLRDIVIMFDIVKRRLPRAMWLVLKYLREGVIELEHVTSDDMRAVAELDRRARRLRDEIDQLRKASRRRQEEGRRRMLARLG